MVRVELLGRPAVLDGGVRIELPRGKTSALLYYLAYRDAWVSRDEIVYLFWPDTSERVARGNLRSLLSRFVRSRAFAVALEIEASRLRWRVASDAADFRAAVREERWADAFEVFGGELLAGFPSDAIPQFATWLEFERATLSRHYLEAGTEHARGLELRGAAAAADRVFERLLGARPGDEELFRRYLSFLERRGRVERAGWAYARFRDHLAHEIEVEPDAATVQLFERIVQRADDERSERVSLPPHNLPADLTPFVGRRDERKAVVRRLRDPGVRLLTILAPGGMGKTRLALACARELLDRYPDGIWFVPLDDARDRTDLALRIAEAVGLRIEGRESPGSQLSTFFASKRSMLVLDGVEAVLAGAPAIGDLLRAAPQVDVLATSRVRLHLSGEGVVELDGLSLPTADVAASEASDYDAVTLFYRCGRLGGRPLPSSPETQRQVVAICRHVDGMPLAIEWAAAWLRLLSPAEILSEIRGGTALLSSVHQDGSERHGSIRAVFDASWRMLRSGEQRALARTAVFAGGFDRDAALAVTDASLPILASLMDHALLRVSPAGRYLRHPLLQQVLRERFAKSATLDRVRERHTLYFLELLGASAESGAAFPIADLENLDLAWRHAVALRRPDLLRGRAQALARAFAGRTATAAELLDAGLEILPDAEEGARIPLELELLSTLVSAQMVTLGFSSPRLRRVVDRLDELARAAGGVTELAPALWCLWSIRFHQADHDAASRVTRRMFALAAADDDADIALQARHTAWTHAFALGAFDEVVRHAEIDELYRADRHARLLHQFGGHDALVCATSFAAEAHWMLGRAATGLEIHRAGLDHAERLAHPFSRMLAYARGAELYSLRLDADAAEAFADRTLEAAAGHHVPHVTALATAVRGWSRGRRDPDAGIVELDGAIEHWRDKRRDFAYSLVLALRADTCLLADRFDEAAASLDEALAIAREHGLRFHLPEILRLRAELGIRRGDASDVVLRRFQAARQEAEEQGANALLLRIAGSIQRWQPSPEHRRELLLRLEAMPEAPSRTDLVATQALLASS